MVMCVGVGFFLRGIRDCGCGTICSYVGVGCSCVEGGYVDISGISSRGFCSWWLLVCLLGVVSLYGIGGTLRRTKIHRPDISYVPFRQ